MTNPLTPNFDNSKPGARLATDRYDFQSHITGAEFRHNATQVDLSPVITIGGVQQNTVQQAVTTLVGIVEPPTINDATPSVKGIVQLAGDLNGTATNVAVVKIQHQPVSPVAPGAVGNVLTWTGALWQGSPPNVFTPGGDLAGNNVNQQVIGLTGTGGIINVAGSEFKFTDTSASPLIHQTPNASGDGHPFQIIGQASTFLGGNGGTVYIAGGARLFAGGGLGGGVQITSDGNKVLIDAQNVTTGSNVLSLCAAVNDLLMPANTGDRVIYIGNAQTNPTSGNPLLGAILYASGGRLFVKQADGNNFAIGSLPNPFVWDPGTTPVTPPTPGPGGLQQTYQNKIDIVGAGVLPIFIFPIPDDTAIHVEVTVVARQTSDPAAQQALTQIMSMGYVRRNGSAPVSLDTPALGPEVLDYRTTAGFASFWSQPTMDISGNSFRVLSGSNVAGPPDDTVSWYAITKITILS